MATCFSTSTVYYLKLRSRYPAFYKYSITKDIKEAQKTYAVRFLSGILLLHKRDSIVSSGPIREKRTDFSSLFPFATGVRLVYHMVWQFRLSRMILMTWQSQ